MFKSLLRENHCFLWHKVLFSALFCFYVAFVIFYGELCAKALHDLSVASLL
mgnify:CR=1 FL=1